MGGGDTAPRAGLVQQIRQNWAVYEDGALASRLQEEELEQHYHNNRHRNQQIREDIPQARQAQHQEQLTAQVSDNTPVCVSLHVLCMDVRLSRANSDGSWSNRRPGTPRLRESWRGRGSSRATPSTSPDGSKCSTVG